jgi:hypothetical protein
MSGAPVSRTQVFQTARRTSALRASMGVRAGESVPANALPEMDASAGDVAA